MSTRRGTRLVRIRGAIAACLLLLGAGATGTAEATAPSLLALDRDGNQLLVLDPGTLAIRHRVATGAGPHEVVGSPDGSRAYVANYGDKERPGDSISVVDLERGRELERIVVAPFLRPHGLELVQRKLYFTAEASRSVARLDLDTRKVDWAMGTGQAITHMLDVAPDGRRVYSTSMLSDTVTAIDVAASPHLPLQHATLGKQPEGLALSPDGTQLWVGQNGDGRIAILDPATLAVQARLDAGASPARIRFTPDGRYAFTGDVQKSELLVFDAAARTLLKRVTIEGVVLGILPAPDNRHVHLTLAASGQVATLDLEDFTLVRKVDVGRIADGMGWAGTAAPSPTPP